MAENNNMEYLKNDISDSIFYELNRASEKYGEYHNSAHENYAVILEEFEEATAEINEIKECIEDLWNSIKHNQDTVEKIEILESIIEASIKACCELIQTAAMAEKGINTLYNLGE